MTDLLEARPAPGTAGKGSLWRIRANLVGPARPTLEPVPDQPGRHRGLAIILFFALMASYIRC